MEMCIRDRYCTPDDWLKVVNVNLNGIFFMAQAFGKYLVSHHKTGNIVNTASMSGTIVNIPQGQASYCLLYTSRCV